MTRLSEVAAVESGSGFPIADQGVSDATFPFLKVSDMNLPGNETEIRAWNHTVTDVVRQRLRARAFPAGTVIFPKIGAAIATNKKRLLTRASCIDNNCMGVTADAGILDPWYLYYQFRAKDLSDFASDSNPPSIRKTAVESWEVAVPPLSDQRRIVDQLSRAENIVRMRREAEQKAKEIIPALFLDMFGDPATNPKDGEVVELRGHDEDRLEAQSVVRLGDVAEVVSGVAKGRKLVGKVTRETPYLRVANVQAGGLDLAEMKYIPATADEIEELAVRVGDVLLTEGGDFDKVGRGALLEADIGECIHQNHVFRVRTHADRVMPEYFAAYLQTSAARQYFLKAAKKTSNLASINMTQLRNLPLPMPPLEIQRDFQKNFRACRALGKLQSEATGIADASFQSLLARVFSEGQAT